MHYFCTIPASPWYPGCRRIFEKAIILFIKLILSFEKRHRTHITDRPLMKPYEKPYENREPESSQPIDTISGSSHPAIRFFNRKELPGRAATVCQCQTLKKQAGKMTGLRSEARQRSPLFITAAVPPALMPHSSLSIPYSHTRFFPFSLARYSIRSACRIQSSTRSGLSF